MKLSKNIIVFGLGVGTTSNIYGTTKGLKEKYGKKALEIFRSTLQVKGTKFVWKKKPTDSYFWFKSRLEGERFDSIAWAVQTWVEELLVKWATNCVKRFKISIQIMLCSIFNF